jgi:hypothetical protein
MRSSWQAIVIVTLHFESIGKLPCNQVRDNARAHRRRKCAVVPSRFTNRLRGGATTLIACS